VRDAILRRLRQPLGSSLPTFAQGDYAAAYAADRPGAPPGKDMTLGVSYSGQIGERAQAHAVRGSFNWRFETW